ncbi:hypothetical protein JCM10450v2_003400 [Rhodotorula kratochvilovae]
MHRHPEQTTLKLLDRDLLGQRIKLLSNEIASLKRKSAPTAPPAPPVMSGRPAKDAMRHAKSMLPPTQLPGLESSIAWKTSRTLKNDAFHPFAGLPPIYDERNKDEASYVRHLGIKTEMPSSSLAERIAELVIPIGGTVEVRADAVSAGNDALNSEWVAKAVVAVGDVWKTSANDSKEVVRETPTWRAYAIGSSPRAAADKCMINMILNGVIPAIANSASRHPLIKRSASYWAHLPLLLERNTLDSETRYTFALVKGEDDWPMGYTTDLAPHFRPSATGNIELILAGAADVIHHAAWCKAYEYRAYCQARYAAAKHLHGLQAYDATEAILDLKTALAGYMDADVSEDLQARALDATTKASAIVRACEAALNKELEALDAREVDIERRLNNGKKLAADREAYAKHSAALANHASALAAWEKDHKVTLAQYKALDPAKRPQTAPPAAPPTVPKPPTPSEDDILEDYIAGAATTTSEPYKYPRVRQDVRRLLEWCATIRGAGFPKDTGKVVLSLKRSRDPNRVHHIDADEGVEDMFPFSDAHVYWATNVADGLKNRDLDMLPSGLLPFWLAAYDTAGDGSKKDALHPLIVEISHWRHHRQSVFRLRVDKRWAEEGARVKSGGGRLNLAAEKKEAKSTQDKFIT